MSDFETICAVNHERVRWANEMYADQMQKEMEQDARKQRKSMDCYRAYKAGAIVTAGSTGIGITFLLIGIVSMHFPTVLMGAIMMGVFATASYIFDVRSEKELDHVCGLR